MNGESEKDDLCLYLYAISEVLSFSRDAYGECRDREGCEAFRVRRHGGEDKFQGGKMKRKVFLKVPEARKTTANLTKIKEREVTRMLDTKNSKS